MEISAQAETTASNLIRDFGRDAKREAIELVMIAKSMCDGRREAFAREVFHQVMLTELRTPNRSLARLSQPGQSRRRGPDKAPWRGERLVSDVSGKMPAYAK